MKTIILRAFLTVLTLTCFLYTSISYSEDYITQWGAFGSGNGQFKFPGGVAVDSLGNVYVADRDNNRIQKFSSNGDYITKWGTGGTGNGQFKFPGGVAVDSLGNVYVADTNNHRIQKFSSNGDYIIKWGTEGSSNSRFYYPFGVAVDSLGNVYVADTNNHRIQKFSSNGDYITKWGTGTEGSGNGQFKYPFGVAVDSLGNVYVADSGNNRIQKFDSNGVYITQWGTVGVLNGQFNSPFGVAVDNLENVYVVDTYNHRIQKFKSNGTYITQWGTDGVANGQFNDPLGVAVSALDKIYVADTKNHRIQVFIPAPVISTVLPSSGPIAGGTSVTITGTNFGSSRGTGTVKFGGTEATYTSWSDTQVVCVTPAHAVGAVDVVLTRSDGKIGTKALGYTYTIILSQISAKTTPSASANIWNIVGPSVITDNKSIVKNFGEAGFGSTWIAWRWNPTSAEWEVPATVGSNTVTNDPFDAGTSWFYALDGDGTYVNKSVEGTQVDTSAPFSVPLKKGWNLICNPFDFSVAWSDNIIKIKYGDWEGTPTLAESSGYVDNRAIWYNPETRAYVTRFSYEATPYVMPKTRGQWLYSTVEGAYVVFSPTESSLAPPSKPEIDSSLWKVELTLRSGKGNDIVEAIADNKEQIGFRDIKPPSLPTSTSSISLIRDDNELSSDRQKESNEMIWTFEVNASEESSLGWRLVGIPDDYKLILEDETGKQIDIRHISNLPIGKVEKKSYILKATRVLAPKVTRLLANYPNPFNPDTWIPYELSEGSEVVIKIYTSAGNLVRTLNLGRKETGYYTTQSKSAYWDGKNEYGERVSSGIYFYSIKTAEYTSTRKMVVVK
jgi:DNA-binding beta-propeller fold protein YncE